MISQRRLKFASDLIAFLRHLPPPIKQKVRGALDALLEDPQLGKPLRADLVGLWSLRVGRFRIIYRMVDDVLEVVAAGPRETIYPEVMERLARLGGRK